MLKFVSRGDAGSSASTSTDSVVTHPASTASTSTDPVQPASAKTAQQSSASTSNTGPGELVTVWQWQMVYIAHGITGQVEGPLAEFCLGPQGGQDQYWMHLILPTIYQLH